MNRKMKILDICYDRNAWPELLPRESSPQHSLLLQLKGTLCKKKKKQCIKSHKSDPSQAFHNPLEKSVFVCRDLALCLYFLVLLCSGPFWALGRWFVPPSQSQCKSQVQVP